jgi:hypothetical protein
MANFKLKPIFKVDDIISYQQMTFVEGVVQRGMNFNYNPNYSIFLMSVRDNSPYADEWDNETNALTYEGHDAYGAENAKDIDQPMFTAKGSLTDNGKFYIAAQSFKLKIIKDAHKVKVYEKLKDGIWCYKGFFNLIDAAIINTGTRNVFKFYLLPVAVMAFKKEVEIPHNRMIPTEVKIEVWKRDKGECVICHSKENLHYDHELPFSKGGSSITAKNVRILCAKHNLKKSNKIMIFSA